MFSIQYGGTCWKAGVPFLLGLTAVLLSPVGHTALFCMLASFVHESGHIAMMLLCGAHPREVSLGLCGIRLIPDGRPLTTAKQAIVLAAGPLLNLTVALLLIAVGIEGTAVVSHLVLGLFNLLPIEALDGGQLLSCLLATFLTDEGAEKVVRTVSLAALFPLSLLGFWVLLDAQNPSLLFVSLYLLVRVFSYERI